MSEVIWKMFIWHINLAILSAAYLKLLKLIKISRSSDRNNFAQFFMRHSVVWRGTWWRLGWVDNFQPEGRGFDSCSSRHVGTLGKSFTYSCLCASAWNADTVSVLQSGAPLSSRGLEGALWKCPKWMNEWMMFDWDQDELGLWFVFNCVFHILKVA